MDKVGLKAVSCGTCGAYDDQNQGQGQGICLRKAPGFVQMPVEHPILRQRGMVPMAVWPVVSKDQRCAEWITPPLDS